MTTEEISNIIKEHFCVHDPRLQEELIAFAHLIANRTREEYMKKQEPVAEVTQEDINQIVWLIPSLGVGRGSKLYNHPQLLQREGWQPIETAPKDGTDILIFTFAGSMYVAGYDACFANVWRIRNDEGVNARAVTHWMPLPAAPKATEE